MSDRELLKLAAKAASYELDADMDRIDIHEASGAPVKWNPLEDDGDALRLAVKLGLHISWSRPRFLGTRVLASSEIVRIYVAVAEGVTREQATRRAIVRAAAAMVDNTGK